MRFVFKRKHPQQIFSLCFGFDSALKTIHAQMFFVRYFWKYTKSYCCQKCHFGRFRWLLMFFCVFKNTDQNNIFVSIVLKAKTEEKKIQKKNRLTPQKMHFWVWNKNCKKNFIFFFCFSFKNNRRTNVILISIFENAQKNRY